MRRCRDGCAEPLTPRLERRQRGGVLIYAHPHVPLQAQQKYTAVQGLYHSQCMQTCVTGTNGTASCLWRGMDSARCRPFRASSAAGGKQVAARCIVQHGSEDAPSDPGGGSLPLPGLLRALVGLAHRRAWRRSPGLDCR